RPHSTGSGGARREDRRHGVRSRTAARRLLLTSRRKRVSAAQSWSTKVWEIRRALQNRACSLAHSSERRLASHSQNAPSSMRNAPRARARTQPRAQAKLWANLRPYNLENLENLDNPGNLT